MTDVILAGKFYFFINNLYMNIHKLINIWYFYTLNICLKGSSSGGLAVFY
jgi:hypothetical protein